MGQSIIETGEKKNDLHFPWHPSLTSRKKVCKYFSCASLFFFNKYFNSIWFEWVIKLLSKSRLSQALVTWPIMLIKNFYIYISPAILHNKRDRKSTKKDSHGGSCILWLWHLNMILREEGNPTAFRGNILSKDFGGHLLVIIII